jgi:putative methionine-R-sulfoxide reductase with GAF domain
LRLQTIVGRRRIIGHPAVELVLDLDRAKVARFDAEDRDGLDRAVRIYKNSVG